MHEQANIKDIFNPRPVALWRVTHSVWEGRIAPPPVIFQTTGPISKVQTPFDSPVHALSKQGVKFDLEVTDGDGVTGRS